MSVCLPGPWGLCNLWHFDIEILLIEEKNQKLLHALSSKGKVFKRMPDVRSTELDAQTTEFSMRILYVPNASVLLPPTASSQQLPGMCCGHSLTTLGSGPTSRQKSWEGVQFVVQLLNSTCAMSQILVMPVLHLNGAICTTFGFKPVQPLLERSRFRISFAP